MLTFRKSQSENRGHVRGIAVRVVALCALIFFAGSIAHRAESRGLVIGRVSAEPQRAIARIDKLARYLALHTADLGITEGRAIIAPDDIAMSRLLMSGDIDLFSEAVVAAAGHIDKSDADVLLHEWRDQVPYYHSLFVVNKDSDIHGLKDLGGRKVALDRIASTTAYLLPMSILRKAGLGAVQISNFNEPAPVDKVGYVFSGRAINTASWVARGVVDAGAVSDIDMKYEAEIPEGIRKELKILTAGIPLPRSLLLARKNLDTTLRKRIVDTLLAADSDSAGKSMLHDYFNVNRYTPFEGEVVERFRDVRRFVYGDRP